MEERLARFRRLKAEKLGTPQTSQIGPNRPTDEDTNHEDNKIQAAKALEEDPSAKNNSSDEEMKFKETMRKQREIIDSKNIEKLSFWDRHIEKFLKFILWLCLLGFFIQVGFGAVYFVVSLIYIMYASMRSDSSKAGPSAYSVFNKDCERIQGTFTAEQFENQLRHGATSAR